MKNYWIWKGVKFLTMVSLGILVFGYVTMQLWNWLLPDLIGVATITFLQALGLLVLGKILFGGFHRGGGWGGHHWKHRMKHKMKGMTPEEREKFRTEYGRRCGYDWSHEPEPIAQVDSTSESPSEPTKTEE